MHTIVRFFLAVPPWHPVVAGALAAVALLGSALVAAGVVPALNALGPVFLLQALAASSGFAGPARRGHYDFLIAGGHSRLRIGVAHWAASVLPGVIAWLAVVLAEFLSAPWSAPTSVRTGVVAALFVVSSVAWAVTVPFPRLTGGLVAITLLGTAMSMMSMSVLPMSLAVLKAPWILVTVVGAAAGAQVAALAWIQRADLPLETAQ